MTAKMPINEYIDHTLLRADATEAEIRKLCEEARQYGFETVCVNPCWIKTCKAALEGSRTRVCTVIDFPLGADGVESKSFSAFEAVKEGADEIDMVLNIGKLKDGDDNYVTHEISEVKSAIGHKTLKVIIECCLLTDEEKKRACEDCVKGGADFVKTSTGFSKGGATVEDVRLLHDTLAGRARVKAAGGIRTKADMEAMIEAGAERIGTSHGVELFEQFQAEQKS